MKYLFSIIVIFASWWLASLFFGSQLIPTPCETAISMFQLLAEKDCWRHLFITLFRGIVGLFLVFALAVVVGIPCGLSKKVMELLSPLVAASQACPPIVWISLLMVWVGMGTTVPIVVIFVSIFPAVFFNIAHGVASLDKRLFVMAHIYDISKWLVLKDIIIPGIYPYLLASLSIALGICFKVTATAEFLGSANGIGSQLYWSYRFLNMPRLFCWALILIIIGASLEMGIIHPLRQKYIKFGTGSHNG